MPQIIDNSLLEAAEKGDIKALAALDKRGFIIGTNETAADYVARLRTLLKNIGKMEEELSSSSKYKCGDENDSITVQAKDRIPQSIFAEAAQKCRELYGFTIDWVPGFFIDPFFLFGGCAFCFFPDFFAMFIIRRNFRDAEKWFIYSRKELISHELCHIARLALDSTTFEENFAYQTATSPFRRLLGGIFYKQNDSALFLGATLLVLLVQILRTFWLPAIPIAPFWALPAIVVCWLAIRYCLLRRNLSKATSNARLIFGDNARKVIFRCSDNEIMQIARLDTADSLKAWTAKQGLKWQIIQSSFE